MTHTPKIVTTKTMAYTLEEPKPPPKVVQRGPRRQSTISAITLPELDSDDESIELNRVVGEPAFSERGEETEPQLIRISETSGSSSNRFEADVSPVFSTMRPLSKPERKTSTGTSNDEQVASEGHADHMPSIPRRRNSNFSSECPMTPRATNPSELDQHNFKLTSPPIKPVRQLTVSSLLPNSSIHSARSG